MALRKCACIDTLYTELDWPDRFRAAKRAGASSVTIHSNALGEGGIVVDHYDNLSHTVKLCSMYGTLLECAKLAEAEGISLNLEAPNITTDHAGNFLATTRMGAEICRLIGSPRLKLLYDVYHMQLNEGCICDTITAYADQIGHVHIADAQPLCHSHHAEVSAGAALVRSMEPIDKTRRNPYNLFMPCFSAAALHAVDRGARFHFIKHF